MKVAIQQPYFFPYLNYFCLIQCVELFIVFDCVQYSRHAWFERNKILKPDNKGCQWIMVPLEKHSHTEPLLNIRINNTLDWKQKILAQLAHYKKRAPYYREVMQLLDSIFEKDIDSLIEWNVHSIQAVCTYLTIPTKICRLSQLNLNYPAACAPDEWALNISYALGGAIQYYNLPGGIHFFDPEKYKKAGIELYFPALQNLVYDQKKQPFEPNLSVIDVLMFNDPEKILRMLNTCTLL